MQNNGKTIEWKHLEDLYRRDSGARRAGLSLVPKVKYKHIKLNSFSCMRVDLAAQLYITVYKYGITYHAINYTGT